MELGSHYLKRLWLWFPRWLRIIVLAVAGSVLSIVVVGPMPIGSINICSTPRTAD